MAARDPITRQPLYFASWLLLVAAYAAGTFGPVWVAGILFAACLLAFGMAWRRARGAGADRDPS